MEFSHVLWISWEKSFIFFGRNRTKKITVSVKLRLALSVKDIHERLTFVEARVQSRVTERSKYELKTLKRLNIAKFLY